MKLSEIDRFLTNTRESLELLLEDYRFETQFQFELSGNFNYNILDSLDYSGIYKFEIKTPFETSDLETWGGEFRDLWEDITFKPKFVPNITKKRLNAHKELTEWFPLYIGKHKSIKRRIKEHLDLKLSKPTFALKLHERRNIYGTIFRVSTIKVDVKNYDIIVPEFENYFRDKENPILGRK